MSASNKKKLRKQEAAEQMTKNQAAASKEAKKQKAYTLSFWVVIVLCVCIAIGAFTVNPIKNVTYKNTVAVEIGDHEISSVELNYFYVDAINNFYSQYKSYITYLGFSTTTPLDEQTCAFDKTLTWADYFIQQAQYNIKSTYTVYDLAMEAKFTLGETEKTSLDTNMTYLTLYAGLYGFKSVDKYLISIYGNGATEESYRAYLEKCAIAEAYYTAYSDALEFDADALSAYNKLHERELDGYNYAYYYLDITRFYAEGAGTKGEDGKTTYTAEETQAAIDAAKAAAEALANGTYADLDAFNKAINELDVNKETTNETTTQNETTEDETTEDETTEDETTEDETTKEEEKPDYKYKATEKKDILFSKLDSLFADWLTGKTGVNEDGEAMYGNTPKNGDVKMFTYTTGSGENKTTKGFYVVRCGERNDNRTNLVNVRHILIMFKDANGKTYSDGIKTFTDAQKKTAEKDIKLIMSAFEAGEKTEAAFEALAKEKSQDTGSKSNGGLYEKVYPGQMVTNFNDWCFDETRQAGDYDIVETEYGYHLIYFVSECDLNYRDYMITESLRVEEMNEWYTTIMENASITEITTKHVNKEMTLG